MKYQQPKRSDLACEESLLVAAPHHKVLKWLHYEEEPLHWLGLIRAIGEPRLPSSLNLSVEWQQPSLTQVGSQVGSWRFVSWTLTSEAPAGLSDLYQLRLAYPDAIRIVFTQSFQPQFRRILMEAGAHWLIPDALTLCHWFSKLKQTEYLHR